MLLSLSLSLSLSLALSAAALVALGVQAARERRSLAAEVRAMRDELRDLRDKLAAQRVKPEGTIPASGALRAGGTAERAASRGDLAAAQGPRGPRTVH